MSEPELGFRQGGPLSAAAAVHAPAVICVRQTLMASATASAGGAKRAFAWGETTRSALALCL